MLGMYPDSGIYWSGPDIPELNIRNGQKYSDVIVAIINELLGYKNAKFETKEMLVGDSSFASRDEILGTLLQKVTNFSTNDIKHSGIPYNNNRLSVDASMFLGTKFYYSVSTTNTGASIGINLTEKLNGEGDVLSSRVVVSGRSESGKNIYMDTPERISSVNVNNAMYPIDIDVSLRVQTKSGIVDLSKKVVLYNPSESGEFWAIYDVKDRSHSGPFQGSLQEMIGSIEATQARLETYHDALKNSDLGDILNIVKGHEHTLSQISAQIKDMGSVKLTLSDQSGKTATRTVDQQTAIDEISMKITAIKAENEILKSKIESAQNVLNNVSFSPTGGGIEGTSSPQNSSLSTSVS